ncbi:MAG: hypothetical protein HKN29_00420 [Rhodothermales bacterium]|nr:hypothetical protein [Rhodothermales bacterium]
MQAITVNPSVAQLIENRQPVQQRTDADALRAPLPRKAQRPDASRMLVHTLRRALNSDCLMNMGQVIATPIGSVTADVVLESNGRRVALLVGESAAQREAVLLVYGAFDAIFRVSALDASQCALAVVSLLETSEPQLFKAHRTARLASLTSVRRVHTGRTTLMAEGWDGRMTATLHRRRINRHGEWVQDFEQAVGQPKGRRQAS